MKKSFQLSFTVLVIFTVLVLGVKGNVEKKIPCRYGYGGDKHPCVQKDCDSTCSQKFKGSRAVCQALGPGASVCLCCGVQP
ncbi:hypothetical protein AALP_AA1G116300 [Arabis alpina]|uniref:Knottin scorpion toxin-like domain-containing protein n=1 Tax=Arabis alpina TaxID=50452 RepID=A0A087HML1_ARAAL|nr:hypothetical protein AALP_AA1G116300 [Arabis alpina]